MSTTPRVSRDLLCLGDPNGVGPEIAVAAARELGNQAPVLVGDRAVVEAAIAATGVELSIRNHVPGTHPTPATLDLLEVDALRISDHRPGQVSADAGAATVAYVKAAIQQAQQGGYRAVIAGPHSETAIHEAGIAFRGYPTLVAELTDTPPDEVFLLLVGAGLHIVHATLHERLLDAIQRLTPALIVKAAQALHDALPALGVPDSPIAIFGINPHAGEGGLFGDDDERITKPAVDTLQAQGVVVDGPLGADVLLAARTHTGYVALYHDQGHVPVKVLSGRTSIAMTIGAGVPFCSVGHGAAFDIAGNGTADPTALIHALSSFHHPGGHG